MCFKKYIQNCLIELHQGLLKSIDYILHILASLNHKYLGYFYGVFLISQADTAQGIEKAAKWLSKAANKQNPYACYKLAMLYERFVFIFVESINNPDQENFDSLYTELLTKAAKLGHANAQYKLGRSYWVGSFGLEQNDSLAHDWFVLAARKLHPKALCNLGVMYNRGDLNHKDYKKAYDFFMAAISIGDSYAMCNLAQMYTLGHYIKRDLVKAFSLYTDAVKNNNNKNKEAMLALAICYEKGKGTKQNYTKALEYLKQASVLGNPEAQLKLADYYIYGYGNVKPNPIKAEQLLKSLAQTGDPYAQFKLATFYDATDSNLQDLKKAYKWYLKAAQQGYTKAQINLAAMYLKGEGTIASEETALFWLENAAARGDQIAQYNLKQLKLINVQEALRDISSQGRVVH